ncbi:hypothetical protein BLJAPNOD_05236 [Ensifer sp. M14]|uniref:Transmembrane protein n=1 Tax=Sinorhizobium sp. M14 TaxID=430451 RepID=A0A142BPM1_9HYPH|nr:MULTISPECIES: hypothetical protein [Sinorhizobium/Ensifer group]AMP35029.1 hypothetical protein pSinB_170 [Sinorhizobium sp. M14]RDL48009.1 hypothetical protein BLJAPNOD_05236 [Ensifer sp. M14]
MIMTPGFRKIALITHIVSSVGSLGAVAGFLALAVVGLTSQDALVMRSLYVAMEVIARFVVVPLVFVSLLTGLVQSVGTTWGLFRHYWVLVKLLLTLFTLIVLLLQMEGISYMATASAETTLLNTDLLGLRRSLVIHAAGGLVVLLVTTMLSVYKPHGMTRYGWRKHQERQGGRR